MILPCVFFFLWNSAAICWVMVAYAILSNLPLIIVQRYNRPRMRKLLAQLEKTHRKKVSLTSPNKNFLVLTSDLGL